VIRDVVDDDPDALRMESGHQLVEVSQGSEHRIDSRVVADVVPEVDHRRGVERAQPHRVAGVVTDAPDEDDTLGELRATGVQIVPA
jgi:hypothetical protein